MFSVRATDEANNVASCSETVDALETTTAVRDQSILMHLNALEQ